MTESPKEYSRAAMAEAVRRAVVLTETRASMLTEDEVFRIGTELGIPGDAMAAALASLSQNKPSRSTLQEILPTLAFPFAAAHAAVIMSYVAGDPVVPAVATGFAVLIGAFRSGGTQMQFRFQVGNAAAWLGLVFGVQLSEPYVATDAVGVAQLFGVTLAIAGSVVILIKRRLRPHTSDREGQPPPQIGLPLARAAAWLRRQVTGITTRVLFNPS